jgi:hypothetical protein
MENPITLTEQTLTEAQDIANHCVENAEGHTVLQVALILAVTKLMFTLEKGTDHIASAVI